MGQQQSQLSAVQGSPQSRWYAPWTWGKKKPASSSAQQQQASSTSLTPHTHRPSKLTASQRLSGVTHEADKIINHILGYLLAITGLIAFIDVVGNGKVLDHAPGLFWAWVIVQGLGVDFQILALLRRSPALYTANRKVFWANILFLVLLVIMLISIGAVFVQSIEVPSGGITGAMATLHIPHWGFVWLRSVMSALLLVIFGIDRALEVAEQQRWDEEQEQTSGANSTPSQNEQPLPQPLPPNSVTQEQLMQLFAAWQNELVLTMQQTIVHEVTSEVRRLVPPQNEHPPQKEMNTEPAMQIVAFTAPSPSKLMGAASERHASPTHEMLDLLRQTNSKDDAFEDKSASIATFPGAPPSETAAEQETNTEQRELGKEEQHTMLSFPSSAVKLTPRQQQMYALLEQAPELSVSDIERQTGFARGYISEQRRKMLALIAQKESSSTEQIEEETLVSVGAGN